MSHCLLSSHSNRGKSEMASTCCAAITCSHCLLSSHSNRGKSEMASTCCAAITCSQHPASQPGSSEVIPMYMKGRTPVPRHAFLQSNVGYRPSADRSDCGLVRSGSPREANEHPGPYSSQYQVRP